RRRGWKSTAEASTKAAAEASTPAAAPVAPHTAPSPTTSGSRTAVSTACVQMRRLGRPVAIGIDFDQPTMKCSAPATRISLAAVAAPAFFGSKTRRISSGMSQSNGGTTTSISSAAATVEGEPAGGADEGGREHLRECDRGDRLRQPVARADRHCEQAQAHRDGEEGGPHVVAAPQEQGHASQPLGSLGERDHGAERNWR